MGYFGEVGDGDVVSVWEKKTGNLLYQVFSTNIALCHENNKYYKYSKIAAYSNRVYPHILFYSREWKDQ